MFADCSGRGIQIALWPSAPTLINLSVTSANAQLTPRSFYRLWSSVDSFFLIGNSSGVTATTSSHPLKAGLDVLILVDSVNFWIAGVVASSTGVLYISLIDPVSAT